MPNGRLVFLCRRPCPVAPEDGTGACPVAPEDGTGVNGKGNK